MNHIIKHYVTHHTIEQKKEKIIPNKRFTLEKCEN